MRCFYLLHLDTGMPWRFFPIFCFLPPAFHFFFVAHWSDTLAGHLSFSFSSVRLGGECLLFCAQWTSDSGTFFFFPILVSPLFNRNLDGYPFWPMLGGCSFSLSVASVLERVPRRKSPPARNRGFLPVLLFFFSPSPGDGSLLKRDGRQWSVEFKVSCGPRTCGSPLLRLSSLMRSSLPNGEWMTEESLLTPSEVLLASPPQVADRPRF